jgi:hypothetical protein
LKNACFIEIFSNGHFLQSAKDFWHGTCIDFFLRRGLTAESAQPAVWRGGCHLAPGLPQLMAELIPNAFQGPSAGLHQEKEPLMHPKSPAGGLSRRGWSLTQADILFCALPIVLFLSIVSLV